MVIGGCHLDLHNFFIARLLRRINLTLDSGDSGSNTEVQSSSPDSPSRNNNNNIFNNTQQSLTEVKTLYRFISLFFCSFNAHSMLIFWSFFVFFQVNWFYLGKNCLIVLKLLKRKQKMTCPSKYIWNKMLINTFVDTLCKQETTINKQSNKYINHHRNINE